MAAAVKRQEAAFAVSKLIRTETIPGTVDRFRALMERLTNLTGRDGWVSSNGERLVWHEHRHTKRELVSVGPSPYSRIYGAEGLVRRHYRDIDVTPQTRGSWDVLLFPRESEHPTANAGIEVYELPNGHTRVDFQDGYIPIAPHLNKKPIGPAFEEFCQMVIEEALDEATQPPTPAENGPFDVPWTARKFERELKAFVDRTGIQCEGADEFEPYSPPSIFPWRTGPEDIREADEIALLCDPFQGLVLELDEKAKDLLVVVIKSETYTEAIAEPLPPDDVVGHFDEGRGVTITPIAISTGRERTRHANPGAHAALSAWLQSLERPSEPTTAPRQEMVFNGTRAKSGAGKKRMGAPLLEERSDVEEKRVKARRYLERVQKGTSKEIAARLVGHSRKTLERWVKRLL